MGKVSFSGSKISLISRAVNEYYLLAPAVRVNLCLLGKEKLCKITLYSGIVLICEFPR